MADSETLPSDTPARRREITDTDRRGAVRPVPPMQVVTKGWFTLREERVPVEQLEKQDRDERR